MKTKVGVFFGGISVEHEVSVISALQTIDAMDDRRYEPVPIYMAKDRTWYTGGELLDIEAYKDLDGLLQQVQSVTPVPAENGGVMLQKKPVPKFGKREVAHIDVAFPVLHGTFGEDGVLQGFFELLNIPYAGCDVTSSAAGMDKIVMKQMLRDQEVPVLPDVWFYQHQWAGQQASLQKKIEEKLGYPVIIKPANLGSSVGIDVARNRESLDTVVEEAFSFASKLVVEPLISDLTEVNCSVLGDAEEMETSELEEVLKTEEILSYADKYQSGAGGKGDTSGTKGVGGMENTDRVIPAPIDEKLAAEIRRLAKETFRVLGCSGVSRVDFMIDKNENQVYVNEINTIPGSLSFYLWEPAGKDFTTLTHEMIQLALKRERNRERLTFSIDTNLFALQGNNGKGGKQGSKR
ncbi:D-alanine--D-alanine ligase family protein [Salicibibacter kimchii]|uniref:D-alanine--D-alanine ligase n=1 Tax=Salicibibacter kimchii TaxID=2099786 RepID=A0A345C1L5_9BACI|nr:D-alanine--D-alanine ligase family protein [Salicibibacter kimchii]AXF57096.1 D-alanine--D-alanine ligase [Salicibibacter kimchii]